MLPADPLNETYTDQIQAILSSRKYRGLGIPAETVASLFAQERTQQKDEKALLKAVREKMHHLVAGYLGDPDYAIAGAQLAEASNKGADALNAFCLSMLQAHASTRERLPDLECFYNSIFTVTGTPDSVHDLACGLHPFGLPWMGLAGSARYYAYDIHAPRVALINQFLMAAGRAPLAAVRDVLLNPPDDAADVAFFLKEAHRLDARSRGANRELWQAVNCRWLVVSLPARSMSGRNDLRDKHQTLVARTIEGLDWPLTQIEIEDEMLFIIRKPDGT